MALRGFVVIGCVMLLCSSVNAQPFQVRDINSGVGDGLPFPLHDNQGTLLFGAVDGVGSDVQLWRSDGSTAGTELVRAFGGVANTFPGPFFRLADDVLFGVFADAGACRELWKTDGTDAGTSMVFGACPAISSNMLAATEFNGQLFYVADDATSGRELWTTDGSAGGTQLVLDINVGDGDGLDSAPRFSTLAAGLLFVADDGAGEQVWLSDGTGGGTAVLTTLAAGASVDGLTTVGALAYYYASEGSSRGLWRTDGTVGGTVRLGDWGGGFTIPGVLGNEVFFNSAIRVANGMATVEVWKTDGTVVGTSVVASIDQGPTPLASRWRWTESAGQLFFVSETAAVGDELWVTDGTAGGTRTVRDIQAGAASSAPRRLASVRGTLYFTADDGTNGIELWQSDGTEAGTILVGEIAPGPADAFAINLNTQFVDSGRHMFFQASEPTTGIELWALELSAAPGADAGVVDPMGDGGIDPGGDDDGGCGCVATGGPGGGNLAILGLLALVLLRRRVRRL